MPSGQLAITWGNVAPDLCLHMVSPGHNEFTSLCFSTGIAISINSLRPSDAIWRQISGSTLAQVTACCLTAPSHYLGQCWLTISGVLQHAHQSNFIGYIQEFNPQHELENYSLKFFPHHPGINELSLGTWHLLASHQAFIPTKCWFIVHCNPRNKFQGNLNKVQWYKDIQKLECHLQNVSRFVPSPKVLRSINLIATWG